MGHGWAGGFSRLLYWHPICKRNGKMKKMNLLYVLLITLLMSSTAFAKGGNSGGGGLFIELDISTVISLLKENCDQFESFKKHNISCTVFRNKIDEVGPLGAGLSIEEGSLVLGSGKTVDAINYVLSAQIEIGKHGWEAAGSDIPLKMGLVAHEILSLMEVEKTGDYTVSRDLVNELRFSGRFKALANAQFGGLSWIRSHFPSPQSILARDFDGEDVQAGKKCGLFLSDKSSADFEDYFVVVGYRDTGDSDDYIGMGTSETMGSMTNSELRLHSENSWGNSSTFNSLTIKINMFGKPLSVFGKSDKRTINCKLNGAVK